MGNSPQKKPSPSNPKLYQTELAHEFTNSPYDSYLQEDYIETRQICCFETNTLKKRKIIWEKNFITHCEQIKDEFKWANDMIELIRSNIKEKGQFFKQINDLKALIAKVNNNNEHQRDILITPSEVQQFKSNIKQSVLLSSAQANKYHDSPQHKLAATTIANTPRRPSRISFPRFNNDKNSTTSRKNSIASSRKQRNSFSSSKSGLRKSIMSFVDDTLSSVFGAERQISKQMANNLEIFLKFSMILEKHFKNPDCMLFHIKKKFIDFVYIFHSDPLATAQKMATMVDSINQFMVILKEAVIDYYHLTTFGQGEPFQNPFIANDENILSLVRTIFFKEKRFYNTIFNAIVKYNEHRQQRFQQILKYLEESNPQIFYVKDKFCLNKRTIDYAIKQHLKDTVTQEVSKEIIHEPEPYRQCKLILNQLHKSMTPVSKMKVILSCSEMMNREIEQFYDTNGLQREKWVLDADQVLSLFCYLIVVTKIQNLHSHLFIMDNFSTNSQMISIFGYYLSVMNCAVQQLQSDYLDKVHESMNLQ